ncbi:hypothetical protein B0H63DRAFT_565786 [Podospora didyma]|uniref:Uncharacterized protein n=1 Tax=Podospora didyma TaxID=330526 RepID=A0AAE0N2L5_9PEZI|nr:hypothetical protein B0H63DRAFT_565786 [Podospora didyma]
MQLVTTASEVISKADESSSGPASATASDYGGSVGQLASSPPPGPHSDGTLDDGGALVPFIKRDESPDRWSISRRFYTARAAPTIATEAIKKELVDFFTGRNRKFPSELLLALFCMSSSMAWLEPRELGLQYLRQARVVLKTLET